MEGVVIYSHKHQGPETKIQENVALSGAGKSCPLRRMQDECHHEEVGEKGVGR